MNALIGRRFIISDGSHTLYLSMSASFQYIISCASCHTVSGGSMSGEEWAVFMNQGLVSIK